MKYIRSIYHPGKTLLMLNDMKLARIGVDESIHRTAILNEILKLQMKNYMQYFKGLQTGILLYFFW